MTTSSSNEELLRLVGITKKFPGVNALTNVHMQVNKGEIHALLGENGAGKSTLMKILSGAYTLDEGEIYWEGKPVTIRDPKRAQELGIAIIYQEFNLIPQLSIAENVWIGREPRANNALRLIDWDLINNSTQALLEKLNLSLDPRQPVEGLGVAEQQMVEIVKSLSLDAKLLIMDEPTSALSETEIQQLYKIMRDLKSRGVSVIFISHRLDEVFEICDKGTILRDGEYIDTVTIGEVTTDDLVRLMVGRTLDQQYPKEFFTPGEKALEVTNLNWGDQLRDINFYARTGEILGIAGLVGAGRTELMKAIFGAVRVDSGEVSVFGKKAHIRSPKDAIDAGIGLLPEDRKQEGLVLLLSVADNISLPSLKGLLGKFRLIDLNAEKNIIKEFVRKMRISTPSEDQGVQYLSGGNQQKVVLAKWLASQSKVLIFDEPTRGIDVGAKVEVYHLMNELVRQGVAVIMVSSEMPELLGMSDRILVVHNGEIVDEFLRPEFSQEAILTAAMGGVRERSS